MEGSLIIKGNYYYAKFRVNGKQKMIATKIPVKGNNKRRAEQKMKEIIESYKDINLECDDVLFTDFLDKWLKSIKGIIKPSTWESYDKTVSGKLKPYFESKRYKFKDMKPEVFTKYFVFLSQHGKPSDRERRLAALYDPRFSPFRGEYPRRQRRTDSGHFRFARTRKRKHHRENLYQPSKDRKGDDDKRSRQRHKFEHRIKVV